MDISTSGLPASSASPTSDLAMDTRQDEGVMVNLRSMTSRERIAFLEDALGQCQEHELQTIFRHINSMLRHDFVQDLPAEVCARIFSLLDERTLVQCELVSKAWRNVIVYSDVWRIVFLRRLRSSSLWQEIASAVNFRRPTTTCGWKRAFSAFAHDAHQLEHRWRSGSATRHDINCHGDGIYCLQYDQEKIVSGNRDDTVKVWNIKTRELEFQMAGHQGSVLCLQYDEHKVITASSDHTIRVWDLATHACRTVLREHSDSVLHVRFLGDTMVSCSKDRTILVWQRTDEFGFTWSSKRRLTGHIAAVNVVEFDEHFIVSASGDRTIRLWSLETGECVKILRTHTRGIACLQYRYPFIASGSSDETICIYDIERDRKLHDLTGHEALVRCVRFNEEFVVSGSYDGSVRVWDFKTGSLLSRLVGHSHRVFRVQFDHLRIISSSQDDTIIIWDFYGDLKDKHELTYDQPLAIM